MLKQLVFGLALMGVGYIGLQSSDVKTPHGVDIKTEENVALYRKGDAGINAAKAKGRATLSRFIELIDAKTPGNYTFKTGIPYGDGHHEHMWVQLTGIDGDTFKGLLSNEPVNATEYKLGQPISVNRKDVSDWMIMSDTAIYGGYTMRHALDRLPAEQADKIRTLLRD